MLKAAVLTFSVLISFSTVAHEGHHDLPGQVQALHGGIVKGKKVFSLEVVSQKDLLKVYPFDHDMKPIPISQVKLEGKITLPRKKSVTALQFKPESEFFSAVVDAKGAHRYDLELVITHASSTERIHFNIEPQ